MATYDDCGEVVRGEGGGGSQGDVDRHLRCASVISYSFNTLMRCIKTVLK